MSAHREHFIPGADGLVWTPDPGCAACNEPQPSPDQIGAVVQTWRNDERGHFVRESWPELADALDDLEEVWPG